MSATVAPYRSKLPAGRDGFAQLLRSEWTKFRTVRGWIIAAVASALLIVAFAYLGTFRHQSGSQCSGAPSSAQSGCQVAAHPHVPIGPGGQAVTDTFSFVHRALNGDGSLTARVSSLSGRIQTGGGQSVSRSDLVGTAGPVQPWAKAGLILAASTRPGSAYVAVMLTGAHGVRLQSDYTNDIAGPDVLAGVPRWLRLIRSGASITGFASADGSHWTSIGSVRLPSLPASVQAGLFVTSPQTAPGSAQFGSGAQGQATGLTAGFDQIALHGRAPGAWTASNVGSGSQLPTLSAVGVHRSAGGFAVTGSGDIAPAVGLPAAFTDQPSLTGVFVGLIVMIVLGTMFITVEYRRGLIDTTFTAHPGRGEVLAAKAIVVAVVTFLAAAAAAAVSIPLGDHLLRSNGNYVYPASTLTEVRVILGIGVVLALAAVLALAVGTALRRSATAVTAVIGLVVLPYVLAFASALPSGVTDWLLRVTPAAAFAVEQTLPAYHQVNYHYAPAQGFYPLAPGLGLAVLIAYTLGALLIARQLLHRRDA